MDRKRLKCVDEYQKISSTRKINFWCGVVICVALVVINSASSSTVTPAGFHNLFERLAANNKTNRFTAVDDSGGTVLHQAVKYFPVLNQTLDIFKAHWVDFNAVDDDGNSAFFNAVQYGRNASFLTTLISYGMEWKTKNKNNDTALHVASLHGNLEAVNLLLSMGSEVNAQNLDGRTPLHQAVNSTNISQNTFEIVSQFLSSGANTNALDKYRKSVLHLAADNKHLETYLVQITHLLITNHADVNAIDNRGDTYLHFVARKGNPALFHEMVEMLDSVNITNSLAIENFGITVLHNAVECMEVQNETLKILQRRGADINAKDWSGWSIFLRAVSSNRSGLFLKTLIAFGADWRVKNKRQETGLHIAARWENLDALNLLMQFGAHMNPVNIYGETPLHYAFRTDNVTKLDIISTLVNHGANGNIQNEYGDFPIDVALRKIEKGGKLEERIIDLLENMKYRPGLNQTFHSSVKFTIVLNAFEQRLTTSTKISRIFQIVHTEDLETIKKVLEHVGNSTNVTELWDEKLHSLLHVAIEYRDYSVVEYLVNSQGFAKKLNETQFNVDLVQLCLENIHTVLPATFEHKFRIMQLLFSIQPELIESRVKKIDWTLSPKRTTEWEDRVTLTPLLYSTFRKFSNGKQLELMQILIDNKANVNATSSEYNFSALHLAATENRATPTLVQIIGILIENRADVNAIDEFGNTFLHLVAMGTDPAVLHETVEYLDLINNTVSFTLEIPHVKRNVLQLAVERMEVLNETLGIFHRRGVDFNDGILFEAITVGRSDIFLKNLISFGADWQLKDDGENTALHIAAFYGNLEALKLFIQLGADVNAVNWLRLTPLHVALEPSEFTRLEIVSELVNHGANAKMRGNWGLLPIDMARENRENGEELKDTIIQLLGNTKNRPIFNQLEASDRAHNKSVKLANILDELKGLKWQSSRIAGVFEIVQNEDLDTIKSVIANVGDSLNITEIYNEDRHSLLHVAIKHRDYSVVEYFLNSQGFAKKLNDTEFNANLVELAMESIHMVLPAAFQQKYRILQLLFSIQPNLIDSMVEVGSVDWWIVRGTPLLYASAREFTNGKQLELIQLLIDNSANVNATTSNSNKTALHLLSENNPSGPNLVQIIRILIENFADANAIDYEGNTFLHLVAKKLTPVVLYETVEYLDSIKNTNSFAITNKEERIVLHEAVEKIEVLNETLEIFKRNGVDFNSMDKYGQSILLTAISGGRSVSCLKKLIAFGADWRLRDSGENTALHIAAYWGNLEALKLFIQLGADVNAVNINGATPWHSAQHCPTTRLDMASELVNHGANVNVGRPFYRRRTSPRCKTTKI